MEARSYPKLKSPPIHEAVLDIRVRARAGASPALLDSLKDLFRPRFPMVEPLNAWQATFEIRPHAVPSTRAVEQLVGLLFRTEDAKFVLQTRVDGLTLSRLSPYTSFDEILPVFMECWSVYSRLIEPTAATRLALRYINRFDVPPAGILESYLRIVPRPPIGDSRFTAFFHRDAYRLNDRNLSANVSTALEPSLDGRSTTLMIDIDAYREGPLPLSGDSLPSLFAELRELKNRIFFSLLADQALERFQ